MASCDMDERLSGIFDRLAPNYERVLDVQTLGMHRHWRRVLIKAINPQPDQSILDLAGGRGEMAKRLAGADRQVIVLEKSLAMIEAGRSSANEHIAWVRGLVEALPFHEASMDAIVCAFGVRNVTQIEHALEEVLRALKPGAHFYCLEVSRPWAPIRPLYQVFCRYIVPRLGAWITHVPDAYDYLVESLLDFPDRDEFKLILEDVGFTPVSYHCMTMGIVCIHEGTKPQSVAV